MIHGMNHFTITAENREQTLDFYCGLLGLVEGHRPDLGFPGAWLYAPGGKQAILHIYWDRPMPATRTGAVTTPTTVRAMHPGSSRLAAARSIAPE